MRRLTLGQFHNMVTKLDAATEARAVIGMRRAGAYLNRTVVVEIGQTKPNPAVDTGELRSSVGVTVIPGGCIVSVDAPHAGVIEHGRRPGGRMPPVQAIMDWMRRKGIRGKRGAFTSQFKAAKKRVLAQATAVVGRTAARASARGDKAGHEDAALRAMAFVMASAIAKNGIAPRHYFRNAWDRSVERMTAVLCDEIVKAGWRSTPKGKADIAAGFRGAAV